MSHFTLQQGINFRDQGGYVMRDGRRVKRGLLFRSGALDLLTDDDRQTLADRQIATVLDFRDKAEAAQRPDKLWDGVKYHNIPANPPNDMSADLSEMDVLLQIDPDDYMYRLYRELPFNNPAYHQLTAFMKADEPKPFIQHCAVGKDRTGVGSALVLFTLGADWQTVLDDYLITEKTLTPFKNQFLAHLANTLTDEQLARCRTLFSAKEVYLSTAISAITEKYTSVDNWLAAEYGLTDEVKNRIRSYYLEG